MPAVTLKRRPLMVRFVSHYRFFRSIGVGRWAALKGAIEVAVC